MQPYDIIGKFYDEIMGDQSETAKRIGKLIEDRNQNARSLLEVACGTGTLMKHLSKRYEVVGVDISPNMLAMAHHKFRHVTLYQNSMTDFALNQKFDVIICMNDSINHLLKFSEWKKTFSNVKRHLNKKGVFILDINTEHKLNALSKQPPIVHEFGKNLLVTSVTRSKSIYKWHLRIFEHLNKNRYIEHNETLYERSLPTQKIKDSLRNWFRNIKVLDLTRSVVSPKSERLYIVATRRN